MPVMNGYEATSFIKNDKKFKKIPIIALTASVMGKDLEKVSKFGFDGYLRKPVILDDLVEEIGRFIEYSFKNSNKEKFEEEDENIDSNKLLLLLNILETEQKNEWEKIKDGGDFTLIESFSIKLKELAKEYNIKILENYADDLLKNIEAFDIEKVDYLMNTYLKLIEKLKAKVD